MSDRGLELTRRFRFTTVHPPVIEESKLPSGLPRSIEDIRAALRECRMGIIGQPGFFMDRSATGTGKSTADIEVARCVDRSLIVTVTHENARELESDMQEAGLNAVRIPGRRTSGNDSNCWNAWADSAESMGLCVVSAVCSGCSHRRLCLKNGYLGKLEAAKLAQVTIATHQRAVYSGFQELAADREGFISIHEDASGLLCPVETVPIGDLELALKVLCEIINRSDLSGWLIPESDDCGAEKQVPDETLVRVEEFACHMADVTHKFIDEANTVGSFRRVVISRVIPKPPEMENLLWRACNEIGARFAKGPWRILLAAATGQLDAVYAVVNKPQAAIHRFVVAKWKNIPNEHSTVLLSDATADRDDLERYLGRPVSDITPTGHVMRAKRVIQFPLDITRRTSAERFCRTLRGVMTTFSHATRVGVITHRTQLPHLNLLGEPFESRIVKSTYFGSGEERASNAWFGQCDLIIVAGTPRINSMAIKLRLIQLNEAQSIGEDPDWDEIHWNGTTDSGAKMLVANRGYRHPVWRRAQRGLVRAAIIQAVGRGRPILTNGCDVAIISTEECGFPLADQANPQCLSLSQIEMEILMFLSGTSAEFLTSDFVAAESAKNISKEQPPLNPGMSRSPPMRKTAEIAVAIRLSDRRTREMLASLESRKFVMRVGARKGWTIVDDNRSIPAGTDMQGAQTENRCQWSVNPVGERLASNGHAGIGTK